MKTSLSKNLKTEAEKKEIKGLFIEAKRLRDQFKFVLEEKIRVAQTERLERVDYNNPSWPYKQAETNAYERAIREMISLLEDD